VAPVLYCLDNPVSLMTPRAASWFGRAYKPSHGRTYERLTRTEHGGDTGIYDGHHGQVPARPRAGHTTQGPGRKPGASLYTRKRLSTHGMARGSALAPGTARSVTFWYHALPVYAEYRAVQWRQGVADSSPRHPTIRTLHSPLFHPSFTLVGIL